MFTENDPNISIQLPRANDKNNVDHPEDENWQDQKICYYIIGNRKIEIKLQS